MIDSEILRLRNATALSMPNWPIWSGGYLASDTKRRYYLTNMVGYHRLIAGLHEAAAHGITEEQCKQEQYRYLRRVTDGWGWSPPDMPPAPVELIVSPVVVDSWQEYDKLLEIRAELLNPNIRMVITKEQAEVARLWHS